MLVHDPPPFSKNLFIGLMPDAQVQIALENYRQSWRWPTGCHLPKMHRLHLTLHQLGPVPVARVQLLQDLLLQVQMDPLELVLCPTVKVENVTVMPARAHKGLRALHVHIADLLRTAGFESVGGKRPHVTLAYNARGAQPPAQAREIPWIAREFMLIWSQLPPDFQPAHHEILARYAADPRGPAQMRLFA
jgi:RNA 2',3'-cyclic 3'-phosphodiesterase